MMRSRSEALLRSGVMIGGTTERADVTGCAWASTGATIASTKIPEDAQLCSVSGADEAFVVPGCIDRFSIGQRLFSAGGGMVTELAAYETNLGLTRSFLAPDHVLFGTDFPGETHLAYPCSPRAF